MRFSHLLLLTVFIFLKIMRFHIGKSFYSSKLTDSLEEEEEPPFSSIPFTSIPSTGVFVI